MWFKWSLNKVVRWSVTQGDSRVWLGLVAQRGSSQCATALLYHPTNSIEVRY